MKRSMWPSESGRILFHIEHYIPILTVKPGSVRNGLPDQADMLPEGLARVRRELLRKGDFEKQFVGILSEVMIHGLANVVATCELALEEGPVSMDLVRSLLSRLTEPAELPDIEARLQLKAEPSSDCSLYDHLLRRNKDVEPGGKSDATQGPENEWGSPSL
ncbi:MAG: hypothetical protein HQL31_08880 [Planctomycetes bacterium]|nr:hypothetical protein [Planctomycetota bacterium]